MVLPIKIPHLSVGVIKRYIVVLLTLQNPISIFYYKNIAGKKGVLVMSLFPTVVIAYLGADFIKALLCVQHFPQ